MENQPDSPGTSGVSRGQNQLHVLPEDWRAASAAIQPLLERIDADTSATQLLILTSDAESTAGVAHAVARMTAARGLSVLGATEARRAIRIAKAAPAQVVIGAPSVVVELLQSASLKMDAVRVVVLAWVDNLAGAQTRALETIMAEVPKDAPRFVFASDLTADVEQMVERYARRARRMQAAGEPAPSSVALSYVAVGEAARPMALRRILDALDPASAFVVTRSASSREDVEAQLRSLGYGGDASTVRTGETPDETAQLVILYDFPHSEEELRQAATPRAGGRVVALVTPRQVPALRRMARGALTPLALPEAAERARSHEDRMRDAVRQVLEAGQFSRELLTLEPLLNDYDGVEVAAAMLRLLESERARPQAASDASSTAMTKLFLNVGEMDGVRAGDLVGAITNEAGISKAELGRVDVREKHSTVEVATAVANAVVAKMNGVTIKGRRTMVKVDEERPRREGPPRDRGDRDSRGPSRDRGPRRDRPTRPTRPTRPR